MPCATTGRREASASSSSTSGSQPASSASGGPLRTSNMRPEGSRRACRSLGLAPRARRAARRAAVVDGLLQRDQVEAGERCADRAGARRDVRLVPRELAQQLAHHPAAPASRTGRCSSRSRGARRCRAARPRPRPAKRRGARAPRACAGSCRRPRPCRNSARRGRPRHGGAAKTRYAPAGQGIARADDGAASRSEPPPWPQRRRRDDGAGARPGVRPGPRPRSARCRCWSAGSRSTRS